MAKWEYVIYSEMKVPDESYDNTTRLNPQLKMVNPSFGKIPESYEYIGSLSRALNTLGADGWELCSSNSFPDVLFTGRALVEVTTLQYVFKRLVQE